MNMTNETPDTLKKLRQILEKQGTANDDITGNSRNHWRKIAAKGLTRGRFKREPCASSRIAEGDRRGDGEGRKPVASVGIAAVSEPAQRIEAVQSHDDEIEN